MINLLISFALIIILLLIFIIDLRTRRIPNYLNLGIFLLGLISLSLSIEPPFISRLIASLVFSIPQGLFNRILPASFGGGDIKLTFAGAFFLGLRSFYEAMIITCLASGLYGIYLLLIKKAKRDTRFALGPFLAIGILISHLA